ncbi:UNVERIFIED_CONTAM: RNA-binding protein 2 [Sesamum indicum]
MADAYWRYSDGRQQPAALTPHVVKRPRSDYDIFRPFVGYKEVRLVTKESRHPGGDPLVLCFVDFQSPAHAATAMDALQGYKFDEHDRDSAHLRIQFARHHGARSGGGHRDKYYLYRLERLLLMAISVLLKVTIGQQIALNVKQRFFGYMFAFRAVCLSLPFSLLLEYSVVTIPWFLDMLLVPRGQLVDWAQNLLLEEVLLTPVPAQLAVVKSGFRFSHSLYVKDFRFPNTLLFKALLVNRPVSFLLLYASCKAAFHLLDSSHEKPRHLLKNLGYRWTGTVGCHPRRSHDAAFLQLTMPHSSRNPPFSEKGNLCDCRVKSLSGGCMISYATVEACLCISLMMSRISLLEAELLAFPYWKQNLNLVEVLMKVRAEELKGAGGIGGGSDKKLFSAF